MAMLNNQTVIFLLDVLWNPGCIAFVDLIHVATMGPLWHHAVCSLPRVPAIDAEAGVLQMIEARGPKYFGTNPEFLQPLY
jgi:acyl-coenzyme A synthetase/AMP-(fatty) acid ligase